MPMVLATKLMVCCLVVPLYVAHSVSLHVTINQWVSITLPWIWLDRSYQPAALWRPSFCIHRELQGRHPTGCFWPHLVVSACSSASCRPAHVWKYFQGWELDWVKLQTLPSISHILSKCFGISLYNHLCTLWTALTSCTIPLLSAENIAREAQSTARELEIKRKDAKSKEARVSPLQSGRVLNWYFIRVL